MAYTENGIYQIVSNRGNGPALSVYGNTQVSDNRNVIVWSRQIINDQKWQVTFLRDANKVILGAFLRSVIQTTYGLNIWRGSTNTNNCDIYPVSGNTNDALLDFLTIDASQNLYRIKLVNHNLYLTATGTSDGADVRWQALNSSSNLQVWKFDVPSNGGGTGSSYNTVWPLSSKTTYPITSAFRTAARPDHDGVDMAAPLRTPIYAIYGGKVSKVTTETSNPLEGISVRIDHDFGTGKAYRYLRSYYLHMDSAAVLAGNSVNQGQVVGYVNNTGDSQGNHLHLGIRNKDSAFTTGGDFYEGTDFINPTIVLP